MNISQRVVEAQNRINGLRDQLNTHIESIDDANPTDESNTITETLNAQIEVQEKAYEVLKKAEANIAKAAANANTSVVTTERGSEQSMILRGPGRMFAAPAKKITPLDLLFKAITVDLKHFGEGRKRGILDVLKDNYGDNELGENVRVVMAGMVTKAAAIPADTTTSGWADTLNQTVIGEFIESLLPFSIYPALRAKGGSFTFGRNGTVSLPARTVSTSVAGAFVAQGAAIPVKQGAFAPITITPRKMGEVSPLH